MTREGRRSRSECDRAGPQIITQISSYLGKPQGKLVSNQAEAPQDMCLDLKYKKVSPVLRQENSLIFLGHKWSRR